MLLLSADWSLDRKIDLSDGLGCEFSLANARPYRFSTGVMDSEADGVNAAELMPQVYDELKRLAQHRMASESPGMTLQATALVHEAYLRVTKTGEDPRWANRRHFFAAASEAMRRILIDQARARQRLKRGSGQRPEELRESIVAGPAEDEQLLALNEALDRFSEEDAAGAELVKMRYFIGMTLEEIAESTGVSLSTVKRQWVYAKAWLRSELEDGPNDA